MRAGWKALVTGGSSGIGAAIAESFTAAGAEVVVLGRDRQRLEGLAGRIGAEPLVTDLNTAEGLELAAEAATRADMLVNSAGLGWAGDLATMPAPDIDALIALNLTVPVRLTRAALPGMRARGRGQLVFVSSIAAVGVGGEAVYSATKAGLRAFAASVRLEVAGAGIGVTTLLPGAVRTPFFEHRGVPYERRFPRPLDPHQVASALLKAMQRGESEVFTPRWLSVAARIRGATPELYHHLARRFG